MQLVYFIIYSTIHTYECETFCVKHSILHTVQVQFVFKCAPKACAIQCIHLFLHPTPKHHGTQLVIITWCSVCAHWYIRFYMVIIF